MLLSRKFLQRSVERSSSNFKYPSAECQFPSFIQSIAQNSFLVEQILSKQPVLDSLLNPFFHPCENALQCPCGRVRVTSSLLRVSFGLAGVRRGRSTYTSSALSTDLSLLRWIVAHRVHPDREPSVAAPPCPACRKGPSTGELEIQSRSSAQHRAGKSRWNAGRPWPVVVVDVDVVDDVAAAAVAVVAASLLVGTASEAGFAACYRLARLRTEPGYVYRRE